MIKDLSEEFIEGGFRVMWSAETALKMEVQAAMWIYRHKQNEWRYYFVTRLVDAIGQQATKERLSQIFKAPGAEGFFPKGLTMSDIDVVSPTDEVYQRIIPGIADRVPEHGKNRIKFTDCNINGIKFDAVVYRARPTASPSPTAKAVH